MFWDFAKRTGMAVLFWMITFAIPLFASAEETEPVHYSIERFDHRIAIKNTHYKPGRSVKYGLDWWPKYAISIGADIIGKEIQVRPYRLVMQVSDENPDELFWNMGNWSMDSKKAVVSEYDMNTYEKSMTVYVGFLGVKPPKNESGLLLVDAPLDTSDYGWYKSIRHIFRELAQDEEVEFLDLDEKLVSDRQLEFVSMNIQRNEELKKILREKKIDIPHHLFFVLRNRRGPDLPDVITKETRKGFWCIAPLIEDKKVKPKRREEQQREYSKKLQVVVNYIYGSSSKKIFVETLSTAESVLRHIEVSYSGNHIKKRADGDLYLTASQPIAPPFGDYIKVHNVKGGQVEVGMDPIDSHLLKILVKRRPTIHKKKWVAILIPDLKKGILNLSRVNEDIVRNLEGKWVWFDRDNCSPLKGFELLQFSIFGSPSASYEPEFRLKESHYFKGQEFDLTKPQKQWKLSFRVREHRLKWDSLKGGNPELSDIPLSIEDIRVEKGSSSGHTQPISAKDLCSLTSGPAVAESLKVRIPVCLLENSKVAINLKASTNVLQFGEKEESGSDSLKIMLNGKPVRFSLEKTEADTISTVQTRGHKLSLKREADRIQVKGEDGEGLTPIRKGTKDWEKRKRTVKDAVIDVSFRGVRADLEGEKYSLVKHADVRYTVKVDGSRFYESQDLPLSGDGLVEGCLITLPLRKTPLTIEPKILKDPFGSGKHNIPVRIFSGATEEPVQVGISQGKSIASLSSLNLSLAPVDFEFFNKWSPVRIESGDADLWTIPDSVSLDLENLGNPEGDPNPVALSFERVMGKKNVVIDFDNPDGNTDTLSYTVLSPVDTLNRTWHLKPDTLLLEYPRKWLPDDRQVRVVLNKRKGYTIGEEDRWKVGVDTVALDRTELREKSVPIFEYPRTKLPEIPIFLIDIATGSLNKSKILEAIEGYLSRQEGYPERYPELHFFWSNGLERNYVSHRDPPNKLQDALKDLSEMPLWESTLLQDVKGLVRKLKESDLKLHKSRRPVTLHMVLSNSSLEGSLILDFEAQEIIDTLQVLGLDYIHIYAADSMISKYGLAEQAVLDSCEIIGCSQEIPIRPGW